MFNYFICIAEQIIVNFENNRNFSYALHENNNFWRMREQHFHLNASLEQFFVYTQAADFYSPNQIRHGEICAKLKQAVFYNRKRQLDLCTRKRRLTIVLFLEAVIQNIYVRIDLLSTYLFPRIFHFSKIHV